MKKKKEKIIALITFISVITAISLDLIDIKELFTKKTDLTGEWVFNFKINESSYTDYKDKVAKYKIHLIQNDKIIKGQGEKFEFNNDFIKHKNRDQIFFEGKLQNDSILCKYILKGKLRESSGSFKAYHSRGTLIGFFSGTGADAKGKLTG